MTGQTLGARRRDIEVTTGGHRCICCAHENRVGAKFCQQCGRQLVATSITDAGLLTIFGAAAMPVCSVALVPRFAWAPDGSLLASTDSTSVVLEQRQLQTDLLILQRSFVEMQLEATHEESVAQAPVLRNIVPDFLPVWHPDGKRVACAAASDHKIWIADGSGIHQLTRGEESDDDRPVWSPDGQLLLYRSRLRVTGSYELRLLDALSKHIVSLPDAAEVAWSPAGDRFVAAGRASSEWAPLNLRTYDRSGQLLFQPQPRRRNYADYLRGKIEWMDADHIVFGAIWTGAIPRNSGLILFDTRTGEADLILHDLCIRSSFSPDRQWVAVTTTAAQATQGQSPDGENLDDVCITLVRGRDCAIVPLTSTIGSTTDAFHWPVPQSWSPDSTRLLFTRGSEIWVVNINGTGLQRLTEGFSPQWSPDGQYVAFGRSKSADVYNLWVMRVGTA